MFSSEEIKKALEESQPAIVEGIKKNLIERLTNNFGWEFDTLVKKDVNAFYEEHIAPEVAVYLLSQKGEILTGVKEGCAEIGSLLAQAMLKQATESLTGYRGAELLQRLMGK